MIYFSLQRNDLETSQNSSENAMQSSTFWTAYQKSLHELHQKQQQITNFHNGIQTIHSPEIQADMKKSSGATPLDLTNSQW